MTELLLLGLAGQVCYDGLRLSNVENLKYRIVL